MIALSTINRRLINRRCLFPPVSVTKFRHQQHDLMSFEFPDTMSKRKRKHNNNNDQSAAAVNALNPLLYLDVSRAVLHATFHNEHINPALLDELRVAHSERKSPFTVTVHRLIAKDHQNPASEKFSKEEVSIELSAQMLDALFAPKNATTTGKEGSSKGRKMVQLDITQMVKEWYKYPKKNHGLLLTTDPPRLRNLIYTKQADHVSVAGEIVPLNILSNCFFASPRNPSWNSGRRARGRSA